MDRAKGAARVVGGGLDEEAPEGSFTHDAPVHDRVQGNATRHTQIIFAGAFMQVGKQAQDRLLQHLLGAGGPATRKWGRLIN